MALILDICRTCLKTSKKKFNLYSDISNDKLISEVLMEEIPIKLHKDDGLPINICDTCLKKLHQIRDFKSMVIESDTKLHDLNKNVENETLEDNVPEIDSIKEEICDEEVDPLSNTNEIEMDSFVEVPVQELNENSASVSGVKDCLRTKGKEEWPLVDDVEIKDEFMKEVEEASEVEKIENKTEHLANEELSDSDMEDNDLASLEDQFIEPIIADNNGENSMKRRRRSKVISKENANIFCKLCDRTFSYRYYSQIHIHEHIGNKQHICDICGKTFAKLYRLTSHQKLHVEEKLYPCDICGKCFKVPYDVIRHKRNHTETKSHQCEICAKMFKSSLTLKGHLKRHTGIKSETCDICGKGFVNKNDLATHKMCHKTHKPFPCPTCGKSFKCKKTVQFHISRVHLKEKKYNCDNCDRGFVNAEELKIHIRTHTGEKPYCCEKCGKTFAQVNGLVQHMPVHTGETRYGCDKCEAKFKYRDKLWKHKKKVHQNK